MIFQELIDALNQILPKSQLGEDNDGQIVVYTNLKEQENGELVDMDDDKE